MTTDERFDRIEKLIADLQAETMAHLDGNLEFFEGFRQDTQTRLEGIEKGQIAFQAETVRRFENIDRYLLDFRSEVITQSEMMDGRLTTLTGLYQSLEPQFKPLIKAVLEFGAFASRIQKERMERIPLPNSADPAA